MGFGDCTFSAWDAKNEGRYAIQVKGTGNVLVRGCDFQMVCLHNIMLCDNIDVMIEWQSNLFREWSQ